MDFSLPTCSYSGVDPFSSFSATPSGFLGTYLLFSGEFEFTFPCKLYDSFFYRAFTALHVTKVFMCQSFLSPSRSPPYCIFPENSPARSCSRSRPVNSPHPPLLLDPASEFRLSIVKYSLDQYSPFWSSSQWFSLFPPQDSSV